MTAIWYDEEPPTLTPDQFEKIIVRKIETMIRELEVSPLSTFNKGQIAGLGYARQMVEQTLPTSTPATTS